MNIRLINMTQDLCRAYMREFILDKALFADPAAYKPYVYIQDECDAYFSRHKKLGRIHLAIMKDNEPIGEVILKNIDPDNKCCTMGISMKNDECKGKGYGTCAEVMALDYAFYTMEMETVLADALIKNTRSRHVLEKVGFLETHVDEMFCYYRCDKAAWHHSAR